jgi:hypothetical protein
VVLHLKPLCARKWRVVRRKPSVEEEVEICFLVSLFGGLLIGSGIFVGDGNGNG